MSPRPPSSPPTFEARFVDGRALSPSVRALAFERVDGQPMDFEPGQWVSLILPTPGPTMRGGPIRPEMRRSYSIASAPGAPRFEIAVTRVEGGAGSTWLHEVAPGAVLKCIGPQGFFTRPVGGAAPSLFVATGTGVTPMRSMLGAAIAGGSSQPVWVLFGCRHEHDLLYRDEMEALASAHPWLRFEPTLSQPGEGWAGRRGYVQTHVRELWAALSALGDTPHAYICGLERMVGSVREILRAELQLPRQQVHSERYD
jgi:CDP-4-dehydro-6-deoxyglucose reductase